MSSSRDQMTFTGAPTAFETRTASETKSGSSLRPNPHLLVREPENVGGHVLRGALILRGGPNVALSGPDVRRAVHRFHGRMVHERYVIYGLDPLGRARERGRRIADRLGDHAWLVSERRELRADAGRVERTGVPFVPFDLERAPPRDGLPVGIGHDGDARGAAGRPAALRADPRAGLDRKST